VLTSTSSITAATWSAVFVLSAGMTATAQPSAAGVSNQCITAVLSGPCVYQNPQYINVYWDNPGQWDIDVTNAGLPETRAQIDGFVRGLTMSNYFQGLSQYGVNAASFIPSVEANASCINQYPVPTQPDFGHTAGFVACEVNSLLQSHQLASPNNVIVNLLMPPSVSPKFVNFWVLGIHITWAGCTSTVTGFSGYHSVTALATIGSNGAVLPTVPFTVIPTNTACNTDLNSLTQDLSHEMVESATDPGFFGWYDGNVAALGDEIADLCDPQTGVIPTPAMPFLNGSVIAYWSNSPSGCVFGGITNGPMATITSVQVNGAGPLMNIIIKGSGFGGPPPDMPNLPSTQDTLYFQLQDTNGRGLTWCAGNSGKNGGSPFCNASTTLGYSSWSDREIQIEGFGPQYGTNGATVAPGDQIKATIFSQATGQMAGCMPQFAGCLGQVPLPATISGLASQFIGGAWDGSATPLESGTIWGHVLDANGFAEASIPLNITASSGRVTLPVSSDPTGFFSLNYSAPATAGKDQVTVTAVGVGGVQGTLPILVRPTVTGLSPSQGPDGGALVTVSGAGYAAKTSVLFGAATPASPTNLSASSLTVSSPPALRGQDFSSVDVTVMVNGVSSFTSPADIFTYVLPWAPKIDLNAYCGAATVTATVYDGQGQPSTGQTVEFSTSPGSFVLPGGAKQTSTKAGTNSQGQTPTLYIGIGPTANQVTVSAVNRTTASKSESKTANLLPSVCHAISNVSGKVFMSDVWSRLSGSVLVSGILNPSVTPCPNCPDPYRNQTSWNLPQPVGDLARLVNVTAQSANSADLGSALHISVASQTETTKLVESTTGVQNSPATTTSVARATLVGPILNVTSIPTATLQARAALPSNSPITRPTLVAPILQALSVARIAIQLPFSSSDISGDQVGVFQLVQVGTGFAWSNAGVRLLFAGPNFVEAEIGGPGTYAVIAAPKAR